MSEIAIQIPPLEEVEQLIEIEVKINGQRRRFNYRVEALRREACEEPVEERAACLKKMIDAYDKQWKLVQIGHLRRR
ncbi:hypothetical protein ACFL4Q_05270 [candidate division KSB1 bacterium]